jgi:hypothetical protein
MLLLKFEPSDIEKCQSVTDVFNMFGIAIKDGDTQDLKLTNKEVFGEKAYYANLILNTETSERIFNHLDTIGEKIKSGIGDLKMTPEALQWFNTSPLHSGSRYDEITKAMGEVNESVLYILTPGDPYYRENPEVAAEKKAKKEKGE